MLDSGGEGLPPDFLQALQKSGGAFGITSLDRSPELEECLLWIYKSHQKAEQQIAPILARPAAPACAVEWQPCMG